MGVAVVVVLVVVLLLAVVDRQGWIALVELMLFVELERGSRNSEITYVQKIVFRGVGYAELAERGLLRVGSGGRVSEVFELKKLFG